MKSVYNKLEIIRDSAGQIVGVNLGADYTSEHECGISKILDMFKCDSSQNGLDARKIKHDASHTFIVPKDGVDYLCLSNAQNVYEGFAKSWPSLGVEGIEDVKAIAGWDERSFLVGFTDHSIMEALHKGFTERDMVVSVGSSGPFRNGGLHLLRYSAIPENVLEASREAARSYEAAEERLKTSEEYKLLESRDREWRKKYPFCHETPWSYFALAPQGGRDTVWLNPRHQQHLNSGHLTLADIADWANGIPGKVIRSKEKWEDLLWELSMPVIGVYATRGDYAQRYRRVDPSLYKDPDESPRVPRKKKHSKFLELPEVTRDLFEAAIKRELLESMFRVIGVYSYKSYPKETLQASFLKYRDSGATEIIRPDRAAEERVGGMLYSLYILGYGDYGACNVPGQGGIDNLSFWSSTLRDEVSYDFLDLCDMTPESRRLASWKEIKV